MTFSGAICILAVVYRLTVDLFSRRKWQNFPPWTGARPWLQCIFAGVFLGATVWAAGRYASFVEPAVKAAGSAKAADLAVLLALPAFVVAAAIREMEKMFAWSLDDLNFVRWRPLVSMALLVGSGAVSVVVLVALTS